MSKVRGDVQGNADGNVDHDKTDERLVCMASELHLLPTHDARDTREGHWDGKKLVKQWRQNILKQNCVTDKQTSKVQVKASSNHKYSELAKEKPSCLID